jgi:sodium/proline symporter
MDLFSLEVLALAFYLIALFAVAIFAYKKSQNSADFIIGGRKMHFFVTALAAHASDMSSWIFLGYPAQVYTYGLKSSWVAIGLIFFMYLNWQFIAQKLRQETARYESLTLFSFFESVCKDTTGFTRVLTGIMSLVFYSVYISAGLMGLGLLLQNLAAIPYTVAIIFGMLIVIPFLLLGGFVTLAWTDLVQGLFLLFVIILVPFLSWLQLSASVSMDTIFQDLSGFIPSTPAAALAAFLLMASWGLGYFGQPHILTKFMGINDPKEIPKSMAVGMTWQTVTLTAATMIGLVGGLTFTNLSNPELLFIELSKKTLEPFLLGLVLSAIIGVTITSMGAQILVVISTLAEDFYKKFFHKEASNRQVLVVSRISTLFVGLIAITIASFKPSSLFDLVSYAWFGLGASFGPLVIACLVRKNLHRYSAWAGILTGGFASGTFPACNLLFKTSIPPLIPGFILSLLAIAIAEYLTKKKGLSP